MKDKYFIDTNVFVYSFDNSARAKQRMARTIIAQGLTSGNGVISYQVIQEFMNVALTRFSQPMSTADCREYLHKILWPMCMVFPDDSLYLSALNIHELTQYSFYDSLIIASADRAGCKQLLSEDLCDKRKVLSVTIRNPF